MKPEEGIATIALGLGKTVMEGEKALRFSPRHPQLLPQRSTVKDILDNSQRFFYSLRLGGPYPAPGIRRGRQPRKSARWSMRRRSAVRALSGYFLPGENRIRESYDPAGYPVLTFAQVLKYDLFPLAPLLADVLALGQDGIGMPRRAGVRRGPAARGDGEPPEFALLQLRPMTARAEHVQVTDRPRRTPPGLLRVLPGPRQRRKDRTSPTSSSSSRKPSTSARTLEIAREIGQLNAGLMRRAGASTF